MQKYSVSFWCVCFWTTDEKCHKNAVNREGRSGSVGNVAFEHVWEGLGKQVFVAKPCKNTVYPMGVGLFGPLSGLFWEACCVVKQCKNTVYPIVVCVFGLRVDMFL